MSHHLDSYTNLLAPLALNRANQLTHIGVRLGHRDIRSDSLVLTPNKHPKPNTIWMVRKMCCDALFELDVRLLLEDTEGGELGREPILVLKAGKVESLMLLERLVRNDLDGKI